LRNDGVAAVNLDGWFLTDDAADLQKWRIPSVTLQPEGHLPVFASGKDRTNGTLHTNFQLDNAGEYLALVQPDGVTVAHEFAPTYPPQRANRSFGTGLQITRTPLIASRAPVRVMVPTSDALGLAWTQVDFDDAGWTAGMTGVGYDSSGSVLNIDINDRSFDISTNTQPGCAVTVTISNTPPQG
jgi:hypothetical protein